MLKYFVHDDEDVLKALDRWGQTVLHQATETGSLKMVKYLVDECNMDFQLRNKVVSANAPIHIAALEGYLDILRYFIEDKKMDVNTLNGSGQPPIFLAAENSHVLVVKYLYEQHHANVHIIDNDNQNILHMCATRADIKVPMYLMDEKKLTFDINLQDNLGNTPVFWASRRRHMDFMRYFIENKQADINIQNQEGRTPLHQAAIQSNLELIKYLYEHGANPELKDVYGYTATDITTDTETYEYMEKLIYPKRTRRSLHLSQFSDMPEKPSSVFCTWMQKMVTEEKSEDIIGADSEGMQSSANVAYSRQFNTNSYLMVLDACVRYCTGLSYIHAKNWFILSPQQMVQMKMNPLDVQAVHQSPSKIKIPRGEKK